MLSNGPRGHNAFTLGHESDGIQFLRNADEFLGSRELWLAAVGAGFHRINLVSLAVVELSAVGDQSATLTLLSVTVTPPLETSHFGPLPGKGVT